MSSITLNFTINIDATLLRTLLATARDIQLSQTIDPSTPTEAQSQAGEPSTANTVVEPPTSPEEPPALPQPPSVPLITNKRKAVHWQKKSITLVSEEEIAQIANQIDMGELTSPVPTANWYTKHHPLRNKSKRILDVLRAAPNRTLTFQSLLAQTGMPSTGNDQLQNYLCQMDKQGIIIYSPKD